METRDPQTYKILGAAMEVHRELGCGFTEYVYQDALALELALRGIPFVREAPIWVTYKGHVLEHTYKADFVCFGEIIVELKAIQRLTDIETAQVIHYLKATKYSRSLLINFGSAKLEHKRLVLNYGVLQPEK